MVRTQVSDLVMEVETFAIATTGVSASNTATVSSTVRGQALSHRRNPTAVATSSAIVPQHSMVHAVPERRVRPSFS
jgi:hypothetical protein